MKQKRPPLSLVSVSKLKQVSDDIYAEHRHVEDIHDLATNMGLECEEDCADRDGVEMTVSGNLADMTQFEKVLQKKYKSVYFDRSYDNGDDGVLPPTQESHKLGSAMTPQQFDRILESNPSRRHLSENNGWAIRKIESVDDALSVAKGTPWFADSNPKMVRHWAETYFNRGTLHVVTYNGTPYAMVWDNPKGVGHDRFHATDRDDVAVSPQLEAWIKKQVGVVEKPEVFIAQSLHNPNMLCAHISYPGATKQQVKEWVISNADEINSKMHEEGQRVSLDISMLTISGPGDGVWEVGPFC